LIKCILIENENVYASVNIVQSTICQKFNK